MKRIVLVIAGCFVAFNVFSQQSIVLRYLNVAIPIYTHAVGDEMYCQIMQDSINEFFFGADILENSPLRFKVSISTVISSTPGPKIVGWIDKTQCGVFTRGDYDDKKMYIKLYSEPDKSASFEVLFNDITASDFVSFFTVLDYCPEHWLQVVFYYKGKLYVGWVDRFCSDAYDSCT